MKMLKIYNRLYLIRKQAGMFGLMFFLLSISSVHVKAQILAYDGFTTVSGGLLGNSNVPTSFGWLVPWDVQDNSNAGYNITNSNPLIVNYLQSSEYYAVGGGVYQDAGRQLDNGFAGNFADYFDPADEFNGNRLIGNNPTYKTIYLSAIVRIDADNGDEKHFYLTDTNIDWCDGCATGNNITGFGYFGSGNSDDAGVKKWTLRTGATYTKTSKTVTPGEVVFVVMKIQFGATATVSLFLNPSVSTFSGTEPSSPDATFNAPNNVPFRTFNLYGQGNNAWSLDEIRFGKTYADVTPSFVPTALTGLAISGGSNSINTPGGTIALTASFSPTTATSPVITWSTSDFTKAVVGVDGVVTATGNGMVTIIGTAANYVSTVTGTYIINNSNQVSMVADDFGTGTANWDQLDTGHGWEGSWTKDSGDDTKWQIRTDVPLTYLGLISTPAYGSGGSPYNAVGRWMNRDPAGPLSVFIQNELSDQYGNTQNYIGKSGTTLYLSFMARIENSGNDLAMGLHHSCCPFGFSDYFVNNGDVGLRLMTEGGNWVLKTQFETFQTGVAVVKGQTQMMVLKIKFNINNDPIGYNLTTASNIVSLFVNPTSLGGAEPAATYTNTITGRLSFRGMGFDSFGDGSHASVDEIRVDASYANVTPAVIPVPLESVVISGVSHSIATPAGTMALSASYFPTTATSPVIIWSSSDDTKAKISDNGIVTATGTGRVTITGIAQSYINSVAGVYVMIISNQPKVSMVGDDFEATPGNWDQLATGYGWAGNWTKDGGDDTKFQIKTDNPLTYQGLYSTPAYASGGSPYQTIGRFIDKTTTGRLGAYVYTETPSDQYGSSADYIGKPGTTMYASFMTRIESIGNDIEFGFTRSGLPYAITDYFVNGGEVGLRLATESGNWVLKSQFETFQTGLPVVKEQTQLIVLKIQFNVNNAPAGYNLTTASNIVSVYLNPASVGGAEPAPSYTNTITGRFSFQALAFDNFGDGDHVSLDEIRLGGSYAQVTPAKDITNITFNGLAINSYQGSAALEIGALPLDAPQDFEFTLSSSDVVSVSGNTITALKNGTVTITGNSAADPSKTAIAIITVTGQAPDMIAIDNTVLTTAGDAIAFAATVTPAEADQSLVWSSSDPTVGTVNSVTGLFTPLANGIAIVTAASGVDNSIKSMATVTVIFPAAHVDVTQIALSKTGDILVYAGSSTITSLVSPANATNGVVTLSLVTPILPGVTLNAANGVVSTDGSANGTVTVTGVSVSNPTVSGIVVIAISGQNAESITISPSETTLTGSSTFTVTILPADADSEITWSVSDTSLATINAAGELTPKSFGSVVTVTATLVKGGLTAGSIVHLLSNTTIISGISSDLSQNVIIYPNPAKDKVSFILPKGAADIFIYNVEGNEVYRTKVTSDGSAVEVPFALSKGFYLIKINTGNVNVTRKLSVE